MQIYIYALLFSLSCIFTSPLIEVISKVDFVSSIMSAKILWLIEYLYVINLIFITTQ